MLLVFTDAYKLHAESKQENAVNNASTPQDADNLDLHVAEYDANAQKIARVLALALVRGLKTPAESNGYEDFILPGLLTRGLDDAAYQAFQAQVSAMYRSIAPTHISNRFVRTYLGLNDQEAGWVRLYFNREDLFFNEGEGAQYWRTAVAYEKYAGSDEQQIEIDYYRSNLTKKSLREMATERHITFEQLHDRLWELNISVYDAWNQTIRPSGLSLYEELRLRASSGEAIDSIARDLSIGSDAARELVEHLRLQDQTNVWSSEEDRLLIAVFSTYEWSDMTWLLRRSDQAILERARGLHLTRRIDLALHRLSVPSMSVPTLDSIRQHPEILMPFLSEYKEGHDTSLAALFGIDLATLAAWRWNPVFLAVPAAMEKERALARLNHRRDMIILQDRRQSRQQDDQRRLQKDALEKELSLFRDSRTRVNNTNSQDLLGLDWNKYTGRDAFAPNRSEAALTVFPTSIAHMVALQEVLWQEKNPFLASADIWPASIKELNPSPVAQHSYQQYQRYLAIQRPNWQISFLLAAIQLIKQKKFSLTALTKAMGMPVLCNKCARGDIQSHSIKYGFASSIALAVHLRRALSIAELSETDPTRYNKLAYFNLLQRVVLKTEHAIDEFPVVAQFMKQERRLSRAKMLRWGTAYFKRHRRLPVMTEALGVFDAQLIATAGYEGYTGYRQALEQELEQSDASYKLTASEVNARPQAHYPRLPDAKFNACVLLGLKEFKQAMDEKRNRK